MEQLPTSPPAQTGMTILYDGDCPFCSAFVRLTRLRAEVGPVRLVNARDDADATARATAMGYDLDQGMLVEFNGQHHYGDAAVVLLAAMSGERGWFNRVIRALFRSPRRAAWMYPWMVWGRGITLRLLGRRPIGAGRQPEV